MVPREAAAAVVAGVYTWVIFGSILGACLGALLSRSLGKNPLTESGASIFVGCAQILFALIVARRTYRLAWTELTADQLKAWREASKLPIAAGISAGVVLILMFVGSFGFPLGSEVTKPAIALVTFGLLLQIPGPFMAHLQLGDAPIPSRKDWRTTAPKFYVRLLRVGMVVALAFAMSFILIVALDL